MATAAVAIIKALKDPSPVAGYSSRKEVRPIAPQDVMSPTKEVHLRSQYFKQLKEIQNLRDEGVLSSEEFHAEKNIILEGIQIVHDCVCYV